MIEIDRQNRTEAGLTFVREREREPTSELSTTGTSSSLGMSEGGHGERNGANNEGD